MFSVENIKKPIADEFISFQQCYDCVFESDNPVLSAVYEQVLSVKGKQLRPVLLLLAAKLCGTPSEQTIYSAVILELLHTVSLIHDDVVDEALQRRGKKSLNAQFGNQVAVLSGDYLLSCCMNICFEKLATNARGQLVLSNLVGELSSGELLQLYSAEHLLWDREHYFQIIKKKTAALFSACTKMGAVSVNADDATIDKMATLGEYLGICFQIRDDVFDYSPELHIGKPSLHDIREGKITLPLINALQNASVAELESVCDFVRRKDFSDENLSFLARFVQEHRGIEAALHEIELYQERIRSLLNEFPDSECKMALFDFTDYVGTRTF
ncbi:MAG: polyprenyl synthetase family protein [Paludibacteraceae bacterium]|nr:polyprenyl synthetase family protein [Paludibacteraceae bacterium]